MSHTKTQVKFPNEWKLNTNWIYYVSCLK